MNEYCHNLLPSYSDCNQTHTTTATLFLSSILHPHCKKKSKKNYRPRLSGGRMNDPIYVNAYMNVTQVFPLIRR